MKKDFKIDDPIFDKLGFAQRLDNEHLNFKYIDFLSGLRLVFVEGRFFLSSKVTAPVEVLIESDKDLEEFILMVTMSRPVYLVRCLVQFFRNLFKAKKE